MGPLVQAHKIASPFGNTEADGYAFFFFNVRGNTSLALTIQKVHQLKTLSHIYNKHQFLVCSWH